jgi:hypothetical protein
MVRSATRRSFNQAHADNRIRYEPAIDSDETSSSRSSGSRGQQVPVSSSKSTMNYAVGPFLSNLMNATSLPDHADAGFLAPRRTVYRVAPNGTMSLTPRAWESRPASPLDPIGLYVGDRSGTIFKIARPPDLRICDP